MPYTPVYVPTVIIVHGGNDHTSGTTAAIIIACAIVGMWLLMCAIPAWDAARPVWGGKNSSFLKSYLCEVFTARWIRELFTD